MNDAVELSNIRFKPISKMEGSLSSRVYHSLREAIIATELQPGSILRKGELCDALGVSRSPVAEAFTRLANEGLVEVVPQSATRVTFLSLSEIREGTFIRQALELAAVEKVAVDRTSEQLTQLNRNLRLQTLMIEDADFLGFHQSDEDMHALLLKFSGFPRLIQLSSMVSSQVSRARLLLLPTPGRAVKAADEHGTVIEAIANHAPIAAREAMRAHLGQLITRLEPLQSDRPELFGES